jgi:putative colanic acid biosynthesis acetyltransferase WcaF
MTLDISNCRNTRNYSIQELILRVLWGFCAPLFRYSPRLFWSWRCFLLRVFRADIGKNVRVFPTVTIFAPWYLFIGDDSSIGDRVIVYNLGTIHIGEKVTISQGAHLCAGSHDYTQPTMPLLKLPINIQDEVWVCADAFVGPNVTIAERAIVGARAVVTKSVSRDSIVAGNPAKFVKNRVMQSTGVKL